MQIKRSTLLTEPTCTVDPDTGAVTVRAIVANAYGTECQCSKTYGEATESEALESFLEWLAS